MDSKIGIKLAITHLNKASTTALRRVGKIKLNHKLLYVWNFLYVKNAQWYCSLCKVLYQNHEVERHCDMHTTAPCFEIYWRILMLYLTPKVILKVFPKSPLRLFQKVTARQGFFLIVVNLMIDIFLHKMYHKSKIC